MDRILRWRVHAALTAVALLFSLNYIVSKVAMRAFHPVVFAYLRVAGAALLMLAFRERDAAPLTRDDRRDILLFAFLAVVINQTFFLGGLSLTTAHVASILVTAIPIFVLIIAIAMRRERATPLRVAGILLAATGAILIIGFEGFDGSVKAVAGDLLIVINCFSYSLYLVLSKPAMERMSARRVISGMLAVGTFAMLPIAIWPLMRQSWIAISPSAWLALAVVIAGPTVGAYLLNGWALARADSSMVAGYTYLQPLITTLLAATFLGETIRGGGACRRWDDHCRSFSGLEVNGRSGRRVQDLWVALQHFA